MHICIKHGMLSEGGDERHTFATWNSSATLLQFRWTESMQTQFFFVLKHFRGNIFVPQVLNYGGIGFSIGHELTHAFDDHGRRFFH